MRWNQTEPGEQNDYMSWLELRDFSSGETPGTSNVLDPSEVTSFLSDHESAEAFHSDSQWQFFDLKEQFPLHGDATHAMAQNFASRRPRYLPDGS